MSIFKKAKTVAKHTTSAAMLAPFTFGLSLLAAPWAIKNEFEDQDIQKQYRSTKRAHQKFYRETGQMVAGCHCDVCGRGRVATGKILPYTGWFGRR